ncbi:hypothetical protein K402DRAFT_217594 [Aulographum hederae CBS 113979]|uniref:Uncharacterized protein n=1 Tax=Aulographum hederae CBS 113979 TaxID=1176131 RepID=A0A6G1GM76_9PEZI|nr:hypothetical protein K402DRAFT_217594 [Aulographum hederae CBS 113979]
MSSNETRQSSSGGVKSLRAMWENQGTIQVASSPSGRGTSPGSSNGTDRPPSNPVRTSFVAVQPSGQMSHQIGSQSATQPESQAGNRPSQDLGTSKGTSENGAYAHRRTSFSLSSEKDSEVILELKKPLSDKKTPSRTVLQKSALPQP